MANKKTALKRAKKEAARRAQMLGLDPAPEASKPPPDAAAALLQDYQDPFTDFDVKKAG